MHIKQDWKAIVKGQKMSSTRADGHQNTYLEWVNGNQCVRGLIVIPLLLLGLPV